LPSSSISCLTLLAALSLKTSGAGISVTAFICSPLPTGRELELDALHFCGVMHQAALYPLIRQEVKALLNGYIQAPMILERLDEYIVPPGLGDRAGVLGAIALARQAELHPSGF